MAQDTPDGHAGKDTPTEQYGADDGLLERRSFLKLTGAASLAGGSLIASGAADAATERHGISFDRTLDAVDDLGMDDSGRQSIDGALSSAAEDGTLVEFPPGTYRVNRQLTLKNVDNFGMVGSSGDRGDVQFVTDSGNALQWIVAVDSRNHLYENFTMQQTGDRRTSFSNVWKLSTGLHIENVELAGWNPRDDKYDTKPGLKPHITSRGGVGVIKDFVCTGGGVVDTYPARRVPIWMGPSHRGELRLVDAHIEESGSHSIYASRTNGCVRVEGGLFRNNDNTNIRIASGHPNKLSWVRGAEIVIDVDQAENLPDGERYQNTRAIKAESGFQGWSGLLIEDCDVVMKSTPNSNGLVQVKDNHGAVTIRNTRLRNEVDGQRFIVAERPDYGSVDAPYGIVLDNVQLTGAAAGTGSAVRIRGRNGSAIKNSCIQRQHEDGVRIVDSNNCSVENTNINVPGQATVFRNASVSTSGITHGDSCPAPTFDGVDGGNGGGSDGGNGGGSDDGSTGSDLPHTLDVSGGGAGDVVDYEFTVDGDLAGTWSLNPEDSVDGSTASGAVAGGTDTYRFSGSITDFATSGDLTVAVDGEAVDHTQWMDDSTGGTDQPSRVVAISGSRADYEFTVSGALEKSTAGGASINDGDTVDGSTASGAVAGGTDAYRFDGEFTAFTLDGDATVMVDGELVDPTSLGGDGSDGSGGNDGSDGSGGNDGSDGSDGGTDLPHTLDVSGGGAGDVVDYEITVDGDLAGTAALNPEDSVDGSTASGAVAGGTDTYRFSGSITGLSASGDLTVAVDGEEVDTRQWTLPNTFVVDGTGDDGTTEYAFSVTGEVTADAATGALEDADTIDGRTVQGSVSGDVDAFRFSGDMTELQLDGDASLAFEDNDG